MTITLKNPIKFVTLVIGGAICFSVWGDVAGWAFVIGSLVGSFSVEKK